MLLLNLPDAFKLPIPDDWEDFGRTMPSSDWHVTRRGMLRWLAVASLTATAGCAPRSASYRFRMTVEVATPQGPKTGSSVMEVRIARGMAIGDQSGVGSSLKGESVVVDLPDGPIFVLLKLPDAGGPLQGVVTDALTGEHATSTDGVMRQFAKPGSAWFSAYKADLPHRLPYSYGGPDHPEANIAWPVMVRFRDLRDPLSVEPVDPDR